MKLSQNLRSTVSEKVPKLIGLSASRHENYESEYSWNYGSTKNTQKNDSYPAFSSSSSSKICPYQNPMTYSQKFTNHRQANDRIYEFQNVLFNNPLKNSSQNIKFNIEDSLKQHQLRNQKSLSDIQQKEVIREQILQQVYRILHQHRQQSAKSLREAVFKIDQSIKRECITQFNRQFISLSFLDQTDKRFNEVENVIKDQKSLMIQMQDMLKQKEYHKVIGITEKLSFEIKELKQEIRNVRLNFDMELNKRQQKIFFIEDRCINLERLYHEISANSSSLEQIKNLKEMFKWSNQKEITNKLNEIQKSLYQMKQQNKKQSKVSQAKEQSVEISEKPIENDQIQQRISIQNDKLFEILQISQNHFKSGLSLSYSFESLDGSLNPNQKCMKKQKSIVNSLKDIKSTKYILDICNQLMDESGNYILDEQGNQIKLSDDQILILKESNIVKYQQP